MILMSGAELAQTIRKNLKKEVGKLSVKPRLAVVLVGNNHASEKYVKAKEDACKEVGIDFELYRLSEKTQKKPVIDLIVKLNKTNYVTGIIVQLPLPGKLRATEILEHIKPKKDVDGLTSTNMGKLIKDLPGLRPATPEGIIKLLQYYRVAISGKEIIIIGRSNLVGKPLAQMLLNEDATVTVAHGKTRDLAEITKKADIVVSAVGQPGLITANIVKQGVVIVDVGTTRSEGNKLKGDVDFDEVSKKASYITPVPGGVGPMTVAMLLSNVVKAAKGKEHNR